MTDAETAAAIEALAHRLRKRDEAMRNSEDYADAEPFALEFMAALRGRGWRVTNTAPPPAHPDGAGRPKDPEVAGLVAAVKAEREAKAAAWRAEYRDGAA